ncbi:hypothetical protein EBU99_11445 [bacterium]|nr:hypothetical protein [bacterium]
MSPRLNCETNSLIRDVSRRNHLQRHPDAEHRTFMRYLFIDTSQYILSRSSAFFRTSLFWSIW